MTNLGDNSEAESVVQKPALIGKLIRKFPLNLLKFWWAFGIIPCAGIGIAAMMSSKMASTSYSFEATILYSGIPIDSAAEKLYIPPDLKTMAQFVKSPVVMQTVCEELELAVPPSALASTLSVIEPKSMQRIGLGLAWGDEDEGKEILDKVIEVYSNHISDTRQEVVDRYMGDLGKQLATNSLRLSAAQEQLRNFNAKANVRDAESELEQLISDIGMMGFKKETTIRTLEGLRVQHQSVVDRLQKQKESETLDAEKASEEAAAEESLADNRRRQDRLNELIEEERRLTEIRGILFAKQQEFERKAKLYEQGYISRAEFQEIDAGVKALKARIMEGDKITAWKKELKVLDEMVVPKDNRKNKGSPIINQTLYKIVELDLDILDGETEVNQLTVDLIEKRRKIKLLQELEQESTRLMKEVGAAATERDTINTQLAALRAVRDYGPYEFAVVAPATNAMSYPSSNKKKLFIMFFVGITGALCGPFVLLALLLSFKQTVDEGCRDHAIPTLSPSQSLLELLTESNTDRARELYNWNRRVGLSLQQSLPKTGSVISVFPSSHRHRDMELLASMGGILSDRDEKVLIIELCAPRESDDLRFRRQMLGQHEEHVSTADALLWMVTMEFGRPPVGLFDYLDGHIASDQDLVNRIDGSRCHLIHVGRDNGHFDRVFSKRMTDLLSKCRDEYSIILMYGPELHRSVDIELQCRHSDGIIILYDRGEPLSQDVRSTLDQLAEMRAPIIGAANRPIAFTAPGTPGLFARVVSRLTPFFSVFARRFKNRPPLLARLFRKVAWPVSAVCNFSFALVKSKLVAMARKHSERKKTVEHIDSPSKLQDIERQFGMTEEEAVSTMNDGEKR